MKETPEYEKYPISEEEMGKHYKAWMNALGDFIMDLFKIGKEVGGDEFIERVKSDFTMKGKMEASYWMKRAGATADDFKDCTDVHKVQDVIDNNFANFYDGYIEKTPGVFEKEVKTCPVAKSFCKTPEICDVILESYESGVMKGLNPKFNFKGFSKLIPKGDDTCRFRVELED